MKLLESVRKAEGKCVSVSPCFLVCPLYLLPSVDFVLSSHFASLPSTLFFFPLLRYSVFHSDSHFFIVPCLFYPILSPIFHEPLFPQSKSNTLLKMYTIVFQNPTSLSYSLSPTDKFDWPIKSSDIGQSSKKDRYWCTCFHTCIDMKSFFIEHNAGKCCLR